MPGQGQPKAPAEETGTLIVLERRSRRPQTPSGDGDAQASTLWRLPGVACEPCRGAQSCAAARRTVTLDVSSRAPARAKRSPAVDSTMPSNEHVRLTKQQPEDHNKKELQ